MYLISDDDIFVGLLTRQRLQKLFREGDISSADKERFFKQMRAFYSQAMEYALANLPLNDAVLMNAMFINIPSRECAKFTQVEYFVSRYILAFVISSQKYTLNTVGSKICCHITLSRAGETF